MAGTSHAGNTADNTTNGLTGVITGCESRAGEHNGIMMRMVKPLYMAVGWLCLGLGCVGIFLPLLPTTPFVLLAAFCFSRSSRRLHRWLLTQRTFGPIIRDWNQHGIIRAHIKWTSIGLIVLMLGYPVVFGSLALLLKVALVLVGLSVIGFIWSRPSRPSQP